MKDATRSQLLTLGMDFEKTMPRVMGSESLLFRLLGKFVQDKSYSELAQAMADQNTEAGFHAAHTLKGVAGNLGLGSLFDAITPLVETLRAGNLVGTDAMFAAVKAQYDLAILVLQSMDTTL